MATIFVPDLVDQAQVPALRAGWQRSDLDVTQGGLGRDARGDVALATGVRRFINRMVFGLLTEQGSDVFDPARGSLALPGLVLTDRTQVRIADVARQETAKYRLSNPPPAEQVVKVVVESVQLASDPRNLIARIIAFTANGARVPVELTLPV